MRILRDKYARERCAFWHKMNSTLLLFSSTSAWHDQNSETTNPKAARNHRKASSQKKILPPHTFLILSPSLRRLDRDSTKKISGEPKNIFMSFSRFLATSRQATAVAKSLDVFFEIGDRKTAANGVRNATIAPTSLEVRAPTEPSKVGIMPSRRGTKVFFGF
jgi:hypothetical protein